MTSIPRARSSERYSTHPEDGDGEVSFSWRGLGRLDRAPSRRDPDTELERAAHSVAVQGAHRHPVDRVDTGRVGAEGDADLLPLGHPAREPTSGGVRHRGGGKLRVEGFGELQHDHAGSSAEPLARPGLRGGEDGVSASHDRRSQNGEDDHQAEDDLLQAGPSTPVQPVVMEIDHRVKYSA